MPSIGRIKNYQNNKMKNNNEEINKFIPELVDNNTLMISGGNIIGIYALIKRLISDELNNKKTIAYFDFKNDLNNTIEKYFANNQYFNYFRLINLLIDDIEVTNNLSLNSIINKLEQKDYDLIFIDGFNQLDELKHYRTLAEKVEHIKKSLKRFNKPIVLSFFLEDDNINKHDKKRLYYSLRDHLDFLIRADGENDCYKSKLSKQIDFKFYDCRKIEKQSSYLFNQNDGKLYLKSDTFMKLYDKALALGLEKDDAIIYAAYWSKDLNSEGAG